MSWASATSPISSTTGPSRRPRRRTRSRPCRRCRWRRGWRARAAASSRAGENVSTSRTGIEEATNSVRVGGSRRRARAATRGSLSSSPSVGVDRGRGGAVGVAPRRQPGAVAARLDAARRAPRACGAGRRRRSSRPRRRVLPGARPGRTRPARRRRAPCSHCAQRLARSAGRRRAGRGRARAPAANAVVAQQRVVVGDRRRAAARAGQRVGEQRDPSRSANAASAAPSSGRARAPGDDDAARGARPARRRAVDRRGRPRRAPAARATGARRRARRRRARPASGSSSTSGSRSGKFRCTGPGRPSSAVQTARHASWRIQRIRSGVAGVRRRPRRTTSPRGRRA